MSMKGGNDRDSWKAKVTRRREADDEEGVGENDMMRVVGKVQREFLA